MAWADVFKIEAAWHGTPLMLNHLFRSSVLITKALIYPNSPLPLGTRTYKYAGLLIPRLAIARIDTPKARPKRLYLGVNQVVFENPFGYDYNLELVIHPWVPQLELTFYQTDEEPVFDVNTEVALMQFTLNRIENKLDNINR